jgi:hypothetical protein
MSPRRCGPEQPSHLMYLHITSPPTNRDAPSPSVCLRLMNKCRFKKRVLLVTLTWPWELTPTTIYHVTRQHQLPFVSSAVNAIETPEVRPVAVMHSSILLGQSALHLSFSSSNHVSCISAIHAHIDMQRAYNGASLIPSTLNSKALNGLDPELCIHNDSP